MVGFAASLVRTAIESNGCDEWSDSKISFKRKICVCSLPWNEIPALNSEGGAGRSCDRGAFLSRIDLSNHRH